ncbi:MAG: hypothetical protein ACLGHT_12620 [Acidimicrobiia bacterium]
MSVMSATATALRDVDVTRVAAAGIAAVVLIDVAVVRAPFLAILAVPYAIGAVTYRGRRTVSSIIFGLFAILFLVISGNFIVATGFDAGWGDLLFAYGGSVLALVLLVALARIVFAGRRPAR